MFLMVPIFGTMWSGGKVGGPRGVPWPVVFADAFGFLSAAVVVLMYRHRHRVMAWTTGLWLIALCYEMVVKYILKVDNPPSWIGIVHGWVYFVYLLFTANLAVKVRWPMLTTVGVLLAGTVPLLGIIVEHFQTKKVKEQFGL